MNAAPANAIGRLRALLLPRLRDGEQAWLLLAAVVVGAAMGAFSALFRFLIHGSHELVFKAREASAAAVLLLPAAGGLLVGLLLYRWLNLQGGHGVPSVMKAVATGETDLSPAMAVRSGSSLITITSGGSAGPEGPIVEFGSVVGSVLGRHAQVEQSRRGTLIACGAAAGVAAMFGAPIGGVFLAIELLVRDFAIRTFGPVVIASAVGSVTSTALYPGKPALLPVPANVLNTIGSGPLHLIVYAGLGIACGLVGVLLVRWLFAIGDWFRGLAMQPWLKPAAGGLAVGLIGLLNPSIIGEGYAFVNAEIVSVYRSAGTHVESLAPAAVFLAMCLVKIAATGITLGSGCPGGTIAPGIVVGATLGAAYGAVMDFWFPGSVPGIPVFSAVGMAGVICASLNVPIAGLLIVYEVSGADYRLVLPLMVTVATSSITSSWFGAGSLYTVSLMREGFDVEEARRRGADPLESLPVSEVMRRDFVRLDPRDNLTDMMEALADSPHDAFAVADADGTLRGLIAAKDLRGLVMLDQFEHTAIIAADAADPAPRTLPSDASMADALAIFGESEAMGIPIMDAESPQRIVGLINRSDAAAAWTMSRED